MRNYLLVRSAWGVRSPSGGHILSEQGARAENYFFGSTVVPLSIFLHSIHQLGRIEGPSRFVLSQPSPSQSYAIMQLNVVLPCSHSLAVREPDSLHYVRPKGGNRRSCTSVWRRLPETASA